ncbi:hypothetical protein MA16_Dca012448 [Dendrobium catenatum]|uniref:Uncharacterized protein n=1 Tax=Dendrobium catenatum TaxID=906689 RepID=A0A2I0WYE9_9ASPA|nr:hypothetical protein MA16_Dca012448 [Dendrobium catenatum]
MPTLTDDSSPPDRTVNNCHSAVVHDSSLSFPLLLSSAHIPLPCIQSSGSPSTPTPSPISSSAYAQPIRSISPSSIKKLEEEMEKLHEQRAVVTEERRAADITNENVGLEAAVSASRSVLDRGSSSAYIAAAPIEAQASLTTSREISSLPVQLDEYGRDVNRQKHMDFVRRADAKKSIKVQAKAKRLSFIVMGVDESQQIEGEVSSDKSDSDISAYQSSRNELLQTVE